MCGVVERLRFVGHRTGRGFIDGCGGPLLVSLMRSDLVEVSSEGVEAPLLSCMVAGGWDGGLSLEVLVHALVTAVLLR